MKKFSISAWIILLVALAINTFIIVNACLNGTISSQESGRLSSFLASIINAFAPNSITDANFSEFAFIVRKMVGHFGLFACDGIFSSLAFHLFLKETKLKSPFYLIGFSLGFGFVVAAVSELIQIFTPDRYGSWGDIGIDFGGYLLGFGLLFAVLIFANFISFKKEQNI